MGQPAWSNIQASIPEHIGYEKGTGGTETSKYPEEKKTTVIPQVAASERGRAQTRQMKKAATVVCRGLRDWPGQIAGCPWSYKGIA
jgi:hypothetical protein